MQSTTFIQTAEVKNQYDGKFAHGSSQRMQLWQGQGEAVAACLAAANP